MGKVFCSAAEQQVVLFIAARILPLWWQLSSDKQIIVLWLSCAICRTEVSFCCFRVGVGTPVPEYLFCSLVVLDPRVGHTMDVLSPFIPVLCHSDWFFHGESCPRPDVVHPGRAWPSSPSCTWHCSLHYLFLQATPLFPHGVIVC